MIDTPRTDLDVFADNIASDVMKGRLTPSEALTKYKDRCRNQERGLAEALSERASNRGALLREAAQIARDSYPKHSDYDERMKIAAHSIAGTLERMATKETT